ncbi:hypothetical protein RPW65_00345 [Pseudomonas sp. NyZ704]|nr:hypothetical protein RPW65_00345 [Pseudomonas sp. NyZ704]
MMNSPSLFGLYIGVFAGICFFGYSAVGHKKIPQLNQVAVVILAWTGAVVGFHLGFIALTADDRSLGILNDQRIAIVLGALAVIWTAAESFFSSVQQVKLKNQSTTPAESTDRP